MSRVTETEVGPIHHKPETRLFEPKPCLHGHLAPRYEQPFGPGRKKTTGVCVTCAKLNVMRQAEARARGERRARPLPMKVWPHYDEAREHHLDHGGYLIRLSDGSFGTTDSGRVAARLRSTRWVERCDELQVWDEVELEGLGR